MRQLAAIAVAFVLVAAPASARAQHEGKTNAARAEVLAQRTHIDHLRHRTWHYQDQRHARRSETRYLERNVHALPRLHRLAHYWYRRVVTARRAFLTYTRDRAVAAPAATSSSDMGAWNCIHSHEGSWNDAGSPYYGGLQMDIGFQKTYGSEFMARWGTADNWPVWAQVEAARRARDGYNGYGARGYGPWPNTRVMCGL